MIIFDAHLDLAWNAIDFNRDLRRSVADIRRSEEGMTGKSRGCNTVSFPELRQGRVVIFIATLLARLPRSAPNPAVRRYTSMEAAYGAACGQLAYYRAMEREGWLRWIKDCMTLDAHVRAWTTDARSGRETQAGAKEEPLGFILSMEGADPVLDPDQVHEWYTAGLRIIGPAHYGISPYAHGTDTEGGLFPPGPALLKAMEEVGVILDVTHLADQSFDEAMDIYSGPVLASHHNCRALVPHQRQLTDEQIKRLIGRGAVIGSAFDAWMLDPGWIRGQTTPEQSGVTIETVVNHIDRVCQIAGNGRHAAIGSDLDGGFGREQSPLDLDTIADLQRLPELLRGRGYGQEAIEGIMHGNWIRFFRDAWSNA